MIFILFQVAHIDLGICLVMAHICIIYLKYFILSFYDFSRVHNIFF